MSDLIPVEHVADQFGLVGTNDKRRRKVIEWTRRYGWPHVKVGRTIAFTPAQFEQIVAIHSVDGTRELDSDRMPGQTEMSARRAS